MWREGKPEEWTMPEKQKPDRPGSGGVGVGCCPSHLWGCSITSQLFG